MKTYPTLFKRTNTGKVQVWWIEQEGDKYRSISGQKDGQKIVADWTVATPKNVGRANATSAEKQADAEIKSEYKKQIDRNFYWENEADIDKPKFFKVMLAESFEDFQGDIDWNKGVGVQIKYNGGRIVARANGLWTRKGERYHQLPHIEDALRPFFRKFPDAVLDGEGFNFNLRQQLNEIMKLLRKTVHFTPSDLQRSKDLIRFYVYDGFGFPSGRSDVVVPADAGYLDRKAAIDNAFFAPCFAQRYVDIIGEVPTWIVHSQTELDKLYHKFLDERHEGAILRVLDQPYQNKRTKYLLKYKPIDDAEFRIISVQDGVGKFAGRVSTFTCQRIDGKHYADGTDTFNATFKGEEADAIKAWNDGTAQSLVGKKVTIIFNGVTGFGKPNYARLDWNNYDTGKK